ncbi:GspH/FimT family pseudopilin [Rhodanobacter hydrolyticus]|uniref:Type II secretion system protein H n=1 Tax=Rhodanobacter hydrolyticus TaxID=2250595 RepID=A0ABW8J3F0_9GAMM
MQAQSQWRSVSTGGMRGWEGVVSRRLACRQQCGFTIVELMITLAVAAILLAIAVPSFRNITLANRLNTAANGLVGAINAARMEAVKRNSSTQFCSNSTGANSSDTLGDACGVETGAVWVLSGGEASQVLAGPANLVQPLQLNGNAAALRFTAQGQAQQAGTSTPFGDQVADICTSQMSQDNHRIITMRAGSILATTTSSGACPSP